MDSKSAEPPEFVVAMEPPFVSATYLRAGKGEEYFVRRLPGVSIGEALDMSVFGEFRPGITFEEATARFGPPARVREEGDSTYHEYVTPRGLVEVGWEVYRSDPSAGAHKAWRLRAYPTDSTDMAFLPQALAGLHQAPEGVVLTHVVFLGEQGTPEVGVAVKAGRLAGITWYPAEEVPSPSGRPPSP